MQVIMYHAKMRYNILENLPELKKNIGPNDSLNMFFEYYFFQNWKFSILNNYFSVFMLQLLHSYFITN